MAIKQSQVPNKQGQAPVDTRNLPSRQIVQRVAIRQDHKRNWLLHTLKSDAKPLSRLLIGYGAAVLGVAAASLCIGIVLAFAHVENLSLVYLPVVLWLAVSFGRGPAIAASFLAFLAYDFFFVPPFYRLSVDDPAQWISLLALLATALVIGQLTATIRAHADEALASQQRTARLYALAQMIATATDEEQVLQSLVRRVVEVFRPAGITAAALLLPDAESNLVTRAVAPPNEKALETLSQKVREQALLAKWALLHGGAVGRDVAKDKGAACTTFYVPLGSGGRVIGILGIVGRHDIHRLVTGMSTPDHKDQASGTVVYRSDDPQAQLFAAFCGQIALALERVMLQQEAIHAEALRESDRLKNVLLGSVTHDLRTPLAAIKAATSSLLEPGMHWREEDRREFIESIDASVDRLSHLVSNLLDLSRLEAGAAVPQQDWHLIGDVIATVLDRLDLAGQTRAHKIEVDASDALPLVMLDHGQIERVLTNLLENALKYSPPGSVIRIAARVVGTPAELEVRVSDQGIGIPADQLEHVFEKFYRVPQVSLPWANAPSPAGTGLGLAICASIVQAHKGRIWAESRPGEGSTFVFTLPIPADRPQGELPELDLPARQLAMPATGATGEQRTDASIPTS